jgi:D-amino peptidase
MEVDKMKLFISADMEGVAGVCAWDEVERDKPDYLYFSEQMSREVAEVCNTALGSGAKEILVKDGHSSARNLITGYIPKGVKLLKGWTRNPYIMMAGLDESFDGVIMTGYHAGAGRNGSPLAHTMNGYNVTVTMNGMLMSEFVMNAYTAALFSVPVIAITGDEDVCSQARELIPQITTIPLKKGIGNAVISYGDQEALELIKAGVADALKKDFSLCKLKLPKKFCFEIRFSEHYLAYKASFYQGVVLKDSHTILFETDDYFEWLRMYFFIS